MLAGCSSSGGSGNPASGSATPSTASTTATTTATATATKTHTSTSHAPSPETAAPKLTHFRVADVTWIGSQGWALGGADCLSGKGTCDAIEHTADGGKHWASMPAPRANIAVPGVTSGCAAPCVSGLRFATSKIGYAFNGLAASGPALFMTLNGGHTWGRLAGGAIALEAANGDVVRLTSSGSGCPGPCHIGVETGPAGGTAWTRRSLGGTPQSYGLVFARTGQRVYLLAEGHVAGGGEHAFSQLYRSSNGGVSWHRGGEPCPQSGTKTEVDSSDLSSAPDGALALVCRDRGAPERQFVITSTNGAASFHAGSKTALGSAPATTLGAATAQVLVLTGDDAYRSTDGGNHFVRLGANSGSSPGRLAWLGFASPSVGHGISADRRSIWTTTDGGRSWSRYRYS
jgi:hypothetical protein